MHQAEHASAQVYGAAMSASDGGAVSRCARRAMMVLFAVAAGCGERGSSGSPATPVSDDGVAVTSASRSAPPSDSTAEPRSSHAADDLAGVALIDIDPVTEHSAGRLMAPNSRRYGPCSPSPMSSSGSAPTAGATTSRWHGIVRPATSSGVPTPGARPIPGVPSNQYMRSIQLGAIDGTIALPRPDSVLGVEPSSGTIRWTFTPDGGVWSVSRRRPRCSSWRRSTISAV